METIEKAQKHDFKIQIAPCNVTGAHTKVISVMLGTLDVEQDDGAKESLEVWGAFSAEGLDIMKRALAEAPFPVDLPTPDGIRANTKYQWVVQFRDGGVLEQFSGDHHFGEFDLHDVVRLWIEPKKRDAALPRYVWDRSEGFLRAEQLGGLLEPMGLPFPTVPCHLEYQRRNTITFAAGPPGSDVFPPHVRHELGWRVDTLHGDAEETIFLIAIEDDDGSWQILKKEPEGSRHFGPRVIEGQVRIVDITEKR